MDVAAAPVASAEGSAAEAGGGAPSSSGKSTTVAPSSASSRSPSATDGLAAGAGGAGVGSDCTCAVAASPPKMAACTPEESRHWYTVQGQAHWVSWRLQHEAAAQVKLVTELLCAAMTVHEQAMRFCVQAAEGQQMHAAHAYLIHLQLPRPQSKQLKAAHAVISRAACSACCGI